MSISAVLSSACYDLGMIDDVEQALALISTFSSFLVSAVRQCIQYLYIGDEWASNLKFIYSDPEASPYPASHGSPPLRSSWANA